MRIALHEMTAEQRAQLLDEMKGRYSEYCAMNLKLDMSRGKPCPSQLTLSNDILNAVRTAEDCFAEDGTDCRNYGATYGLPEMARIFAELLQVPQQQVIVGGVSSLNLMYDTVARAMSHGLATSEKPWSAYERVRFICPVPGYDRHCTICEHFGIEMIPVPLTGNGPDMDMVEALVAEDDSIKGMWCNPVYSNYTGECYSDETLQRLAKMPAKAKDFTVLFDNAYCVHDLYGVPARQLSFYNACCEAGNAERAMLFASTSKITFAGGGISCVAMGP
ncbi:MAG: aminotransferase class I/II-fold pyridoxal phosphate-dependent enzyme, partial [Oscillospiraceae bacterium]|nr:aminotransferase class I/II-fold pyridoxal phosphate-dependent enzyme [Oscillospiraceae bacterium]